MERKSTFFNNIDQTINEKNLKVKNSEFLKFEEKILSTECYQAKKTSKKEKCIDITNKIFDFLGKFMPRSRMILPFRYKDKKYFSSRYVTFTSILLLTLITTGSIITLNNVGKI